MPHQTPQEWAEDHADHYSPGIIRVDTDDNAGLLAHEEARALRDRLTDLLGERTGIPIVDVELLDLDPDDLIVPRGDFGGPVAPQCGTSRRKCLLNCKSEGPPGPIWCQECGHDPKCCNCVHPDDEPTVVVGLEEIRRMYVEAVEGEGQ